MDQKKNRRILRDTCLSQFGGDQQGKASGQERKDRPKPKGVCNGLPLLIQDAPIFQHPHDLNKDQHRQGNAEGQGMVEENTGHQRHKQKVVQGIQYWTVVVPQAGVKRNVRHQADDHKQFVVSS